MIKCKGCGTIFKGHRARVYCSNSCQWKSHQAKLVEKWLATGQAVAGTHQGHYVRLYLHEAQEGNCAVCNMGDQWNQMPLNFVLDHIDGDATNNVRSNLRLICPNCDSQLPTYKSRNKGNGRHYRRERYAGGKSY